MASIRVAVGRVLAAACLAQLHACSTILPAEASFGYPPHIELQILDQDKRVFILEPKRYDLLTSGKLKTSDFRMDANRTVVVLVGTGRIDSGDLQITIEKTDVRVNGNSIGEGTSSAVIRPDGTVVRGASIRTAR